jgi:hypothetical protein
MHHVFDFHGGPPLLEFQVHLMQCSTAPVFSTIQPIGCEDTCLKVAEERIIPTRSDQTNGVAVAATLLNI